MNRPQTAPMLRHTSSGRDMPLNYFEHTVGSEEDEAIRPHLLAIRNLAHRFGFESLFDVVLAEARLSPIDARAFAEQGGFLSSINTVVQLVGTRPASVFAKSCVRCLVTFISK